MLPGIHSRHTVDIFGFRFPARLGVFVWLLLLGCSSQLWAQVTSTASSVNFGTVAVGAATGKTQSVSFTVPSGITLGGISAVTLGVTKLDFTVTPGGSCAVGSTGRTCTVQVTFVPVAAGLRMGAVVLTNQQGATLIAVPVYGVGSGPLVAFGPGMMTTVAGNGVCTTRSEGCYSGDGGAATSAQLNIPDAVALDYAGNLYIADAYNNVVRKVTPSGVITTVAGNFKAGYGYSGDNGPATSAQLYGPGGLALDGAGNLYIADTWNHVIRKVTPGGVITTVAGNYAAGRGYSGDGGPATSAQLNTPNGLAVDGAGNLYIADSFNFVVRKVTPGGVITTVAGGGDSCSTANDSWGDGCAATSVHLGIPYGVAVDATGDFYFSDYFWGIVHEVTADGTMTRIAGDGQTNNLSGDGGLGINAQLLYPTDLALDAAGNLYIADTNDQAIRKVTPGGTITTVAGTFGIYGRLENGTAPSEYLNYPYGVKVDGSGNLYVADSFNYVVRKVDVADAPALRFTNTSAGQVSAAQDVTVLNLGNAALGIGQISTATHFTLGGADTTCSASGQQLEAAASCVLGIEFSPTVDGAISGSVVLTDNTGNVSGAMQSIGLQGNTIIQQTQTITFPNPGPLTYGMGPVTLQATASSGLAVTYTVEGGPATVSGSALTIYGVGTVGVKAEQAGNLNVAAAPPISITFQINPAGLVVVANNQVAAVGAAIPALSGTLTGVVGSDGITASYSTTAVKGSAAGSYAITATLHDPNYLLNYYSVTNTSGVLTIYDISSGPAPWLSANSAAAGGAGFTLTVGGPKFAANSVVLWNGAVRKTTYVSSTELTAAISAADIAQSGMRLVTVANGAPNAGTSAAQPFAVMDLAPVPTISGMSYSQDAISAYYVTVVGTGFTSGSAVESYGVSSSNSDVSPWQIGALFPAYFQLQVTVKNPAGISAEFAVQ